MASLPPVQPTVSSCGVLLADDDCTDVMMDNDVNFSSTIYPFVDCYPTTDNGGSYGGLPTYWNDRTYTADMISSSEGTRFIHCLIMTNELVILLVTSEFCEA
jgi:hypothetical protein